jgi:hypothetical protein
MPVIGFQFVQFRVERLIFYSQFLKGFGQNGMMESYLRPSVFASSSPHKRAFLPLVITKTNQMRALANRRSVAAPCCGASHRGPMRHAP